MATRYHKLCGGTCSVQGCGDLLGDLDPAHSARCPGGLSLRINVCGPWGA